MAFVIIFYIYQPGEGIYSNKAAEGPWPLVVYVKQYVNQINKKKSTQLINLRKILKRVIFQWDRSTVIVIYQAVRKNF